MMQHSAENKGGKNKQSKMPNLKKKKHFCCTASVKVSEAVV